MGQAWFQISWSTVLDLNGQPVTICSTAMCIMSSYWTYVTVNIVHFMCSLPHPEIITAIYVYIVIA
jgi:hypothetical protein